MTLLTRKELRKSEPDPTLLEKGSYLSISIQKTSSIAWRVVAVRGAYSWIVLRNSAGDGLSATDPHP